uniref:Oxysterol-binding protein n=1 Tax=Denticeps clupeoides TaxID=299321 RepID=A0AAY4CUY1_9TELE
MEQLGSTLDHSQSLVGGLEKPPPGCQKPTHSRSSSTASSRHSRQVSFQFGLFGTPGICEGFLMKRRNWPLKGWHKRYFVLDKGVLRYSRTQQDVSVRRGKLNGSLDVSLAVMSINKKSKRIDLDAGDNLYHVKAKSHDLFYIWVTKLSAHRVFKKNEAAHVHNGFLQALSQGGGAMAATRNGAMADAATTVHGFICRPSASSLQPGSSCRSSSRPPSVAESAEYFDASDDILCGSSSEGSEEGSGVSDGTSNSDLSKAPEKRSASRKSSGHRTSLPAVCPDNSHVGLMTILYNNIGKDLSRVSMPAALNEPINLLQRLCEELEYSELLDAADNTADPYERMVYIAAFAISGYATAQHRNRYKPFNPVLGETYECVRGDRAFRFISEQVCHHPPISACHAESHNFCFWQDQRWKNKFWGKSLEIMPAGMVNVTLSKSGDHYEWNKAVTCIHNVLSQQRYLEHYGEVAIHNLNSPVCSCKINFIKSRYWGSEANKNEVQGVVLDQSGHVVHRFGGFWHEGIFCDTLPNPQCVWKPNPQPKDSILYFGFSSFAIELNELTGDLQPLLPPTDTRLRPDQRMLEEGRIEETDRRKDEIEERQRERRKTQSKTGEEHVPRFFRKSVDAAGRDVWVTNGTYWKLRENPGFSKMKNPELW